MKRAIIATLAAAALVSTMAHGQDAETYPPTVPLMLPATDSFLQSFVRLINKSDYAGEVEITAVDDGGNVFDPVTIQLAAGQTIHFNSGDLTDGNASKGIEGIGSPIEGNWRLSVNTLLDVQVLSFIRARDGFLTAMHDVVPWQQVDLFAGIFNPASNTTQQSRLRLINWGAEDAIVEIEGKDDANAVRVPILLTLPAGHSRTLTAVDLEEGAHGLTRGLGDGAGKWQLTLRGELRSIVAQSLLYASSGHISNISRDGFSAAEGDRADHGDTLSNPTPLALNGQRFGRISPPDDQDYFAFVIPERSTLTLYTTGPTNTVGVLYDSSSSQLTYDHDSGVDYNFRIERDVDAGTYFVRVEAYVRSVTGNYTVHAEFDASTETPEPPEEPTNRYYGAYAIGDPIHRVDGTTSYVIEGHSTHDDTQEEADQEALADCEDDGFLGDSPRNCRIVGRFGDGQCIVYANNTRPDTSTSPWTHYYAHYWAIVPRAEAREKENELDGLCATEMGNLFGEEPYYCWSAHFCNPTN